MLSIRSLGAAAALTLASFTPSALAAPAPPAVDAIEITATLSQEIYELGDTLELTVTAPVGTYVCIALDTQLGTTTMGTIQIGLGNSPAFQMFDLGFMPPEGSVTVKLPTNCDSIPLTQGPLYIQVGGVQLNPLSDICLTEVQTLLVGNADCNVCPANAVQDPNVSMLPTSGAFYLPGLGGEFEFESQPELAEFGDDSATLSGVLRSMSDPTARYILSARMSGRLDVVDAAFPPAGSPALKLKPEQFLDNGGTVDPRNWHYYTDFAGDLTGLDSVEGAYVRLSDNGNAIQFGRGANGKNLKYGACGELDAVVVQQPFSGAHLTSSHDSELVFEVGTCTPTLEDICVDPSKVTGHVLYWPEVSKHFMPVGDVTFEEYADGTAHLFGTVAVIDDPDKCFEMDVYFSDRVDFGNAGFPPANSPKLGNVDPDDADEDTFHYYLKTEGVLRGCEDFEGAVVVIDRMGPAFQVGVGANYHDLDYGASGWITLEVVEQPNSGTTFAQSTTGDLNMDFKVCPEDEVPPTKAEPIAHWDFDDQDGTKARDRVGNVDLYFDGDDFEWIDDSNGTGLKFKKKSEDMLRSSSTSSGSELRKAIQHSKELTLQVFYRQEESGDKDARLFSWSTGTDVTNRNLTMISDWENDKFRGELRLKTTDGTSQVKEVLGFDKNDPVVYTMTWSEADGVIRSYLDGVLIGTKTHTGSVSNWSEHKIRLGNESGGERSFKGKMYDVKLWDVALTDAQVQEAVDAVKP